MENILSLIGRKKFLFSSDILEYENNLKEIIKSSSFLVIGAAGSIGQAVTKEIFKREPRLLHCVDISENNLVELVRDIRSSYGYIKGEFKTFAIDAGSIEFEVLLEKNKNYNYILNLSALKHVRSESDPLTLMRMIEVNIFNAIKMIELSRQLPVNKFFCVSTDKAANPVNIMGASKRIMELYLNKFSNEIDISMARFANVAFSNGSLLDGFEYRIKKRQPISAPSDILRYFITHEESGVLCLLSCLKGQNKDIFFPKLDDNLHLINFEDVAKRFLFTKGYEPYICSSEDEARQEINHLLKRRLWPCYFEKSDTTGEKGFEEFFTVDEEVDLELYNDIGVVKLSQEINEKALEDFKNHILELKLSKNWSKESIVSAFSNCLPDFIHEEKGKYLDQKM
jgi:FlaA1/EpsC-like NDP-sugar epimerase